VAAHNCSRADGCLTAATADCSDHSAFEATDANIFCAAKVLCVGAAGSHGYSYETTSCFEFYCLYVRNEDDANSGFDEGGCKLDGFAEAVPPACWDTSRVTNMTWLFAYVCGDFNENIDSWNTAAVTSMERMFL